MTSIMFHVRLAINAKNHFSDEWQYSLIRINGLNWSKYLDSVGSVEMDGTPLVLKAMNGGDRTSMKFQVVVSLAELFLY